MTPALIDIDNLIQALNLLPHPEGGYYRETYRATGLIPVAEGKGNTARSFSTAIYYLLTKGTKSKLHKIASDEIWHFYLGGPMTILQLGPEGQIVRTVLGTNLAEGQVLQHAIPAGWWFGCHPNPGVEFSLGGCTVAPGFEFSDLVFGDLETLVKDYPGATGEIRYLLS